MNLAELKASGWIIFEAVAGSYAYGTNTVASDEDIRGIFCLPREVRLGWFETPAELADEKQDIKYFELRKFFDLAAVCNPNIIELLWLPQDCLRICTAPMLLLLKHRSRFLSRRAADTFAGYAVAQVKKARGQNKMVNNPQPATPPAKEEFCWFVPLDVSADRPCRPVPLQQAGIDLAACHVAALEHATHLYRLYEYGPGARGVFRNGMLVCESIPLTDEQSRFRGLLIFNEMAFERALRDWRQYWEWREHRNPERWRTQENGDLDYDPKNMMHCIRLLLSGLHVLEQGEPLVRFTGADLDWLCQIRAGRYAYAEVIAHVDRLTARVETAKALSPLPDEPDARILSELFLAVQATHDSPRG